MMNLELVFFAIRFSVCIGLHLETCVVLWDMQAITTGEEVVLQQYNFRIRDFKRSKMSVHQKWN